MVHKETKSSLKLVILSLFLITFFTSACEVTWFKSFPGYHVTSHITTTIPCTSDVCSLIYCAKQCLSSQCVSVSYRFSDKMCFLHDRGIYLKEVTFQLSPDWKHLLLQRDFVWFDNDWVLIFRARSGIGQSAYDTWVTLGIYDDHPAVRNDVPVGCSSVNASEFCDRHFRSKLIDDWDSYRIDKVKIVLYEKGTAKESIIFKGRSSTSTTWFAAARVMSSSWTDIPSNGLQWFSQKGDDEMFRRWFVNEDYNGCENDNGWMAVLDKNVSTCPWEAPVKEGFPVFLYAPNHKKTVWYLKECGKADVMAVFVKFY